MYRVDWHRVEGVAPSTPGDGPRTAAPDCFGIRDALTAPTERRPPTQQKRGFRRSWNFPFGAFLSLFTLRPSRFTARAVPLPLEPALHEPPDEWGESGPVVE